MGSVESKIRTAPQKNTLEGQGASFTDMSVTEVLGKVFGEQTPAWRQEVSACGNIILGALAISHPMAYPTDPNVQAQSKQWKFAELHGSMARALLGGLSDNSRIASNTLLSAQESHAGRLKNPRLAQVLSNSTWMWDMDIVVDPGLLSSQNILQTLIDMGVEMNEDGLVKIGPLSGNISRVNIGRAEALRLVMSPAHGPRFSFDIIPKAEVPEEDFRIGPQNSSKRNAGIMDITAIRGPQKEISVRISKKSNSSEQTLALPSEIVNPQYHSIEQAVSSFLGWIRTEISSPTNQSERDRFVGKMTRSIAEIAGREMVPKLLIDKVFDEYRVQEIMREWLVLLCADKELAIEMIQKSHLDSFLRIEENLRELQSLDQNKVRSQMIEDPVFLEQSANLFDLTRWRNRRQTHDPWQMFKNPMTRAQALENIQRGVGVGIARLDDALRSGYPPDIFDITTTVAIPDLKYLGQRLADGPVATVFVLPHHSEARFITISSSHTRNSS